MYFILAVLLFALISACTLQKNTATPTPELQQLRITNRGSSDITGLVVLFPGTNSVEMYFYGGGLSLMLNVWIPFSSACEGIIFKSSF